jgi:hypothetical protein
MGKACRIILSTAPLGRQHGVREYCAYMYGGECMLRVSIICFVALLVLGARILESRLARSRWDRFGAHDLF